LILDQAHVDSEIKFLAFFCNLSVFIQTNRYQLQRNLRSQFWPAR